MKPAKPATIRLSAPVEPSPVVVTTICSLCGLDWGLHGETPTTEDCIRLLKSELAQRPVWPRIINRPSWPYPVVSPRWVGAPIVYIGTDNTSSQIDIRIPERTAITCSSVSA